MLTLTRSFESVQTSSACKQPSGTKKQWEKWGKRQRFFFPLSKKMYCRERKLISQIPPLLAVGCLMLFAMGVLKYTNWTTMIDLGKNSTEPRSTFCKDRLNQSPSLSPRDNINSISLPTASELIDLGKNSTDPRSTFCKDWLNQSVRLFPQDNINCSQIIRGDPTAVQKATLSRYKLKNKREPCGEEVYLNMTKDCGLFKATRRYIQFPLSKDEEDFPIAYSMVIHEKIEMFERLLRSIYTPQNVYCVHVDQKASEPFKQVVQAIASCFENVFVATKLERVVYASWSRVQADLNCMEDLLKSKVRWRYLLNTCGTDFPIKTNAEIVQALKLLNGKNNMESTKPHLSKVARWKYHHEVNDSVIQTIWEKGSPPQSSPIFTGNAYFVVTREFVQHLFEDPVVKQLLEWSKDTYSPDEHIWATLQRMPGVPGSVPFNDKFDLTDMNAIVRLVKWKNNLYPACTSIYQRNVCVYGVGDLHWIITQHHLFANKFDPKVDDYAIQCLEEYLHYKVIYGKEL